MMRRLFGAAAALVESFLAPEGGIWRKPPPSEGEIRKLEKRALRREERKRNNRSGLRLDKDRIGKEESRQTVRREGRQLEAAQDARARREARATRKKNLPRALPAKGEVFRRLPTARQGWNNRAKVRIK